MVKIAFFFLILLNWNAGLAASPLIIPGSSRTDLYFPQCKGKYIAVIANQTSLIGQTHLVDSLKKSGFKVKVVFAPEHGFRGMSGAGEHVQNSIDKATQIPIVSLYGNHLRPSENDLKGVNLMIFDIQDVGARFYTYISTLQYIMEASAELSIPLIVLDRPNPNGFYVDGPVLEKKFSSFVGMQQIPVVYGMTIGEYAQMLNGEKLLRKKKQCKLTVIPIQNYTQNSLYELPVPPSPNLPDMDAVYLYPSVCFFEGTSVSLGRGTSKPFRLLGYPENESGGISFIPQRIEGAALYPPYRDTVCFGIDISGEGKSIVEEPKIHLKWLLALYASFPDKGKFFNTFFDKLAGNDLLRKQILNNKTEEEIRKSWQPGIDKFKQVRKKYLLYPDVN